MKQNKFPLLIAAAAFSFLFYHQEPAINLAVFSVLFALLQMVIQPQLIHNRSWLMALGLCLLSATVTAFIATPLNVFTNFSSLLVMAYVSQEKRISILTGMVYSGMSMSTGWMIALVRYIENLFSTKEKKIQYEGPKWYYYGIPLVLVITFIGIYRESSGAFQHLTDKIDLSFISFTWIVFTMAGLKLLYGLFYFPEEYNFFKHEATISNISTGKTGWNSPGFAFTGLISFWSLNALLLIVNITDIAFLAGINSESEIPYANLIHQGVGSLIVSIILAVGFILLWLNGRELSPRINQSLKLAAGIWITLNVILIATNIFKNQLYIDAYGLTHKRIGVYFFLALALVTLLFCLFKISGNRNNIYIYRRFGIISLALTATFNLFHWDMIIVKHNIKLYETKKMYPDTEYLLSLSDECIPTLYRNWKLLNPDKNNYLTHELDYRMKQFLVKFEESDWRSKSIADYKTYERIKLLPAITKAEPREPYID